MKAIDNQSAHFIVQDSGIGANKTLYAEARSNSPGYRMYDDAVQSNVLVKNASGDILVGQVCVSQQVPHCSPWVFDPHRYSKIPQHIPVVRDIYHESALNQDNVKAAFRVPHRGFFLDPLVPFRHLANSVFTYCDSSF